MNKIVKNEMAKTVLTMVHQMMAVAVIMGAAYAIETIAARQDGYNPTATVVRTEAERGQRGGNWYVRNDAERGQRGGNWYVRNSAERGQRGGIWHV